ncbi:MAG: CBS domain-containing protein [Phycisphaerales bacterium]
MSGETVSGLMTSKVRTVDMDQTLAHVREIFARVSFHHLVVIDNEKIVGLISDRDLFRAVSPFAGTSVEQTRDAHTLQQKVHQIMTRQVITCRGETPAWKAGRLMLEKRVSCLPVVDREGQCVGILTLRDIARWAIERMNGGGATTRAA